jgi:mycothiol synthase
MNVNISSSLLVDDQQVKMMRELVKIAPGEIDPVDFEELIALPEIRERVCLWFASPTQLAAFGFVDLYDNLVYAIAPGLSINDLGPEIITWCESQASEIAQDRGEPPLLDAVCGSQNHQRFEFLLQNGFIKQPLRSLIYMRPLDEEITLPLIQEGFRLRHVKGEGEADALVALHRACFGTNLMTIEYRLSMMRTAVYDPSLDLIIEVENGDLIAFCVCSLETSWDELGSLVGFTDPIGVRPGYQKRGFGKAILVSGLYMLQKREVKSARLGTSSDNIAMQKLAESAGFRLVSEKLWFRKELRR